MEITVTVFNLVAVVILVRTVLTHFLNWLYRETAGEEFLLLPIVINVVEIVVTLSILHSILN